MKSITIKGVYSVNVLHSDDEGDTVVLIVEEDSDFDDEEENWMDSDCPTCPECGQDWGGTL